MQFPQQIVAAVNVADRVDPPPGRNVAFDPSGVNPVNSNMGESMVLAAAERKAGTGARPLSPLIASVSRWQGEENERKT